MHAVDHKSECSNHQQLNGPWPAALSLYIPRRLGIYEGKISIHSCRFWETQFNLVSFGSNWVSKDRPPLPRQIEMFASSPVCCSSWIASNNFYSVKCFNWGKRMFDKFGFCWQKLLKAVPINVGSLSSEDVFIFSLLSRRRSRVGGTKVQLPGMARRGFKGFTQSSKKSNFSHRSHIIRWSAIQRP